MEYRSINRARLEALSAEEHRRFRETHPRSRAHFEDARRVLLGGVPMSWMNKWAGGFPIYLEEARGARLKDVDGHTYIDFCLGDTGAMAGHSPYLTVRGALSQLQQGVTTMLPTEDAAWVGRELRERFGLPYWQFTLSATDANRFSIRLARALTRRPRILSFNYSYHGTVDETFASIQADGSIGPRAGNVGPPVHPAVTTRVVEFNDLEALERALAHEDVACVLAEPALTNIGIVLPEPGFHEALRRLTRRYGTYLIIDETHTFSAGVGGCTKAWGLEPDFLTIGKSLGGGVPVGAFGVSEAVAAAIERLTDADLVDTGGVGGTLAGNALSLAAMRATLGGVLTEEAFARMVPLADRFVAGVREVLAETRLPWHIVQLGARAEFRFSAEPPRNGGQSAALADGLLEDFLRLFALNRGVLRTPFHNMALMCPVTTVAHVDRHTEVFRASVEGLLS